MPTVLRHEGFVVVIWPNDHRPPHVHVFKAGTEAKILLSVAGGETDILETFGMSTKDALKALQLVTDNNALLLEKWRELHG